jgi:hypothetical protein
MSTSSNNAAFARLRASHCLVEADVQVEQVVVARVLAENRLERVAIAFGAEHSLHDDVEPIGERAEDVVANHLAHRFRIQLAFAHIEDEAVGVLLDECSWSRRLEE